MRVKPIFKDRRDAGRILAEQFNRSTLIPAPLVLALPRGGVPVGYEVAQWLGADLDIFLVRKLGLPGQEELAIGAIASGGTRVLNQALVAELHLSQKIIDHITVREDNELKRREALYRRGRPPIPVRNRTAIVVDDGLATGASMKAAARALHQQGPAQVVIAAPVAAKQTCEELRADADDIVCVHTPEPFMAVGVWYEDFSQTTDEEVEDLLQLAQARAAPHFRNQPHQA